mgnify:CR=1 FL=1
MHPSVTTIYGEPGTIKTSLALTWPKPIAFYDLEYGGRRAWMWQDMVDKGVVVPRSFQVPHHSLISRYEKLSGYIKVWQDFALSMEKDLSLFPTVVWDTGTVVWALDRDAMLEELQLTSPTRRQLLQIEYGEPNRRMTELFNLAKAMSKNLVITHHETDEYINLMDPLGRAIMDERGNPVSVSTGKKIPEGFRHTVGLSDWVLRTAITVPRTGTNGSLTPTATVEKSAYGLLLRGQVIDWPTYDKLDALLVPDTTK